MHDLYTMVSLIFQIIKEHFSQNLLKITNFWVKFKTNDATKISSEGCLDVDDFLKQCKKELSSLLNSYSMGQLKLLQPDGTKIKPCEVIQKLNELGIGHESPLVLTVAELPVPALIGSSKKQLTYKGLSTEASCRKYFDALAKELSSYYDFNWGPENDHSYPTFGDILYASKHYWNFKYRNKTYAEKMDESGFTEVATKVDSKVPLLAIPLPELFSKDEWVKLREWNQKTNTIIHSARLPTTSTGKYFVILPHGDYNQETIAFFKIIGVKGQLYAEESQLEVRDEVAL